MLHLHLHLHLHLLLLLLLPHHLLSILLLLNGALLHHGLLLRLLLRLLLHHHHLLLLCLLLTSRLLLKRSLVLSLSLHLHLNLLLLHHVALLGLPEPIQKVSTHALGWAGHHWLLAATYGLLVVLVLIMRLRLRIIVPSCLPAPCWQLVSPLRLVCAEDTARDGREIRVEAVADLAAYGSIPFPACREHNVSRTWVRGAKPKPAARAGPRYARKGNAMARAVPGRMDASPMEKGRSGADFSSTPCKFVQKFDGYMYPELDS